LRARIFIICTLYIPSSSCADVGGKGARMWVLISVNTPVRKLRV